MSRRLHPSSGDWLPPGDEGTGESGRAAKEICSVFVILYFKNLKQIY